MKVMPLVNLVLALVLSPLLFGVINRTKAWVAGRRGQPLLQPYHDLLKLLRKGATYSTTTTWVFRAAPAVGVAAALAALAIVPFGGAPGLLGFRGDLVLFAYLFGLMRFFIVLGALDTGSAFEGMGASREVTFAALAEPALLLALAAVAHETQSLSLSAMFAGAAAAWHSAGTAMVLVMAALLLVFLAENARIPVDDPTTHLELTMIHEVMVLDHGGPDFGLVEYGAAVKLWAMGALLVGIALPFGTGHPAAGAAVALAGMLALAVVVGLIESTMARLRLARVPQLLAGASACAILALALALR